MQPNPEHSQENINPGLRRTGHKLLSYLPVRRYRCKDNHTPLRADDGIQLNGKHSQISAFLDITLDATRFYPSRRQYSRTRCISKTWHPLRKSDYIYTEDVGTNLHAFDGFPLTPPPAVAQRTLQDSNEKYVNVRPMCGVQFVECFYRYYCTHSTRCSAGYKGYTCPI